MILALGIGFGVLTLALAFGLDGIRKEAARSANAQIQIAEALGKLASQAATIEQRQRDIQAEQLKLAERVAAIKDEQLRREVEEMIANGARVLDG